MGGRIQVAYAIPPTPEGVRARGDRGSYVLAFGPCRRRAWVVGQRPLEYSLGSRGRPLGGFLEQVLKILPSWGYFGPSYWGSHHAGPPRGNMHAHLASSEGAKIRTTLRSGTDPSVKVFVCAEVPIIIVCGALVLSE